MLKLSSPCLLCGWLLLVALPTVAHAQPTTEWDILTANDGEEGDLFGWSVSLDGDTLLVGAYGDDDGCVMNSFCESGAAYVFVRDGSGNWSQQAKLTPDDTEEDDLFGHSVSIDGDTALVGAIWEDSGGNIFFSGSAYVFVRDGSGNWSQQAKLTASDASDFVYFGQSVSLDGDTALVGAYQDSAPCNVNDSECGSAYVFVRDGNGNWSQQAKLVASDIEFSDWFGNSVSLDGDTVLVGSPGGGSATFPSSGSAYVFVRDGSGNWSQQAELTALDALDGVDFGYSVSLDGDTALVGAWMDTTDNGPESGSAYVFVRDGSGNWNQQDKLTASNGAAGDSFGYSVSLDGDAALVGTYDGGVTDSGSAYLFVRDSSGSWTEQAALTASDAVSSGYFGQSVALDGNTAMVGADDGQSAVVPFSGRVYAFVEMASFRRGDSNSDATVNIADASFSLGVLFQYPAGAPSQHGCQDAADANDDGTVDIADAITILTVLFAPSGGPMQNFPEPVGTCGTDPTDDSLGCETYGVCP